MTAPYYTGDGIPLKFKVTDADGVVNPTNCTVHILNPGNALAEGETAIDGNEVSYNVPGVMTGKGGGYKAYFCLTLPSGLERTHKIEFTVIKNPEQHK